MKNHDKFNHLAFDFRALRRERQRKNKFIKICTLTKFSCDIFFHKHKHFTYITNKTTNKCWRLLIRN